MMKSWDGNEAAQRQQHANVLLAKVGSILLVIGLAHDSLIEKSMKSRRTLVKLNASHPFKSKRCIRDLSTSTS